MQNDNKDNNRLKKNFNSIYSIYISLNIVLKIIYLIKFKISEFMYANLIFYILT